MKAMLLSPYSKAFDGGKTNAKNYHRWPEVVAAAKQMSFHVIQVGLPGEAAIPGVDSTAFGLRFRDLAQMVRECTTWCSVDNFFHHFCAYYKKPGVVVWGKSDPLLFGHPTNTNLVKRERLRPLQFELWKEEPFDPSVFPEPEEVISAIRDLVAKTHGY